MSERSEKTFIEIWHDDKECTTNWVATKNVYRWKDGTLSMPNGWQINGSNILVYDKEDLAALRKLLDAIEKEIAK